MNDLERAKERLRVGGYTCVLARGEQTEVFTERGVKPLVALCESGKDFRGFSAADKVVGRATAFLYAKLGVCAVYAGVLSKSAREVFARYEIAVEYGELVEFIVNRAGNGVCPFEEATRSHERAEDAYGAILQKMREMAISLI